MDQRLWRLRHPPFRHCITLRCRQSCDSCAHCRPDAVPTPRAFSPSGDPGKDTRLIRLHGGDAFRAETLGDWLSWARQNPRAHVDVEGPAATLAAEDGESVAEQLIALRPDGITLLFPTAHDDATQRLTGTTYSPTLALVRLGRIAEAGIAISLVFPCNANTVEGLRDVVRLVDQQLGSRADLVLRRAPKVKRTLPLLNASGWDELDALSAQLAGLPSALPGGLRLHMDPESGYPACALRPEARRPELIPARGDRDPPRPHPLDACFGCAWNLRCQWTPLQGAVPAAAQLSPLAHDEALALQEEAQDPSATHRPHARRAKWSRAEQGLPELLCVAPWTSMAATESYLHPVPCALSWTENAVPTEEAARELGLSDEEMRGLEERATQPPLQGFFHCLDNEELSLAELWNNPLLRVMRREMFRAAGASKHCRSMCRTVMGVEDRSAELLARHDHELTPEVVANRRLLLDEMRAGRTVLTATPLELVMGVSANCNITCGFCHGPEGRYGELTDARREEIERWLPNLMSLSVSGPGEPLMSRNYLRLLERIAGGNYPSLRVALTTNGTLLTPAFLERHKAVQWAHVRVSLNAGSAKVHERMTGKALFSRVIENIEALVQLRDSREPPFDITLSCVLSEMGMGDLHAFASLATRLKTRIVVEPMYGDLEGLSPWTRPEKLVVLADELASVADVYALANPPLSKAFRAVERFARERLQSGDLRLLEHH